MKLSTRSRYGLRAMYDLAVNQNGPVSLKTIAQRQEISEAYLEQLFASLRRAGLVVSSRGAQGGYELSRPSSEISIGEILNALEGSTSITDCVGGEGCKNASFCPSHPVFARIQEAIDGVLGSITLENMIEQNSDTEIQPEEH
jgi:Rrf2 family cysteine metabolism transcriptional repressor